MTRRYVAILAALLLALVSGCGTAVNVYRSGGGVPLEPYGGVKEDLDHIRDIRAEGQNAQHRGARQTLDTVGWIALVAIDLPFTIIGDTLTLPLALKPATYRQPWEDEAQEAREALKSKPPQQPPTPAP